jgi:exodeoxyribonuclease VII small subunit
MPKREPAKDESFEALFRRLEETARKLEAGNLGLDESLALYEEGAAIADRLRSILDAAELRIRTVQQRGTGAMDEQQPPDGTYRDFEDE